MPKENGAEFIIFVILYMGIQYGIKLDLDIELTW